MDSQNQNSISEIVTENSHRKAGRPRSLKKAYCIRMKAHVYEALVKVAAQEGFRHLGDWLESMTEEHLD